jgi:arylsulfatase A-like enzyme
MMRPLQCLFLLLVSWGLPLTAADASNDSTPNVLFIAVDDLRPELGCYGSEAIKTPHIDALASRGMTFSRAYCQVAVCGASRASLMTGLRPTAKRFLDYDTYAEKEAPEAITLPQSFRNKGYHCISNGKIFHHNDDTADRSWSEPPWRPKINGGSFLDEESKSLIGGRKNRGPVFEHPDVEDNAYPDGQIADKTIQDLTRLKDKGTPFFLACGFYKPHLPFYAPKKYWDLYDPAAIELADNQFLPEHAPSALKGSGEIHSYHNRDMAYNSDAWHRNCRHGYYACVSYVDAQIGRVLNALENLGLKDNTIIVLWGDHGWHLGEHTFWGKHNVMHLSSRVPLIMAGPGIPDGKSCERLVELIDLYPTLCDMARVQPPTTLQGSSFTPLFAQPARPWKKAAFSSYGPAVSIITERYNYAEFKNGEFMLYDLQTDPDENRNIAKTEEYSDTRKSLQKLLQQGWENARP